MMAADIARRLRAEGGRELWRGNPALANAFRAAAEAFESNDQGAIDIRLRAVAETALHPRVAARLRALADAQKAAAENGSDT